MLQGARGIRESSTGTGPGGEREGEESAGGEEEGTGGKKETAGKPDRC